MLLQLIFCHRELLAKLFLVTIKHQEESGSTFNLFSELLLFGIDFIDAYFK